MFVAINNQGNYIELNCRTMEEAESKLTLMLDADTIAREKWELVEE